MIFDEREESVGRETVKRLPTVGIGTSAGGVQALQRFFENLPDYVDAAFVVIVHLDPDHQSELSQDYTRRLQFLKLPIVGRPAHAFRFRNEVACATFRSDSSDPRGKVSLLSRQWQ